jgi:hypothetical protein
MGGGGVGKAPKKCHVLFDYLNEPYALDKKVFL